MQAAAMDGRVTALALRSARRLLLLAAAVATVAVFPAASPAAITTLGSQLSAPATLNTGENLNYPGTDTRVPPSPEAPNGVVHTYHYGADTALWNAALASGTPAALTGGQALKISLEGCALPASGGPAPLTQIHFQSLSPLPGGGAKVELSSQPFNIPVCGQGGASGSTISTYEPINLCVARGGFVAFNDEGGFVEHFYQSGVRYQVMAPVAGSTLDSFIRGNATGNGSLFSPLDTTSMDGFAVTHSEELMMQVAFGTGSDARYVCPGGTKDAPPVLAPLRVSPQTDGVNHARIVSVAIYCRPAAGCKGRATLTLPGTGSSAAKGVGSAAFNLPGNKTSHLSIRVSSLLMAHLRKHHGVATTFAAVLGGSTFSQTITVKIF
jgi:hypothetical protein